MVEALRRLSSSLIGALPVEELDGRTMAALERRNLVRFVSLKTHHRGWALTSEGLSFVMTRWPDAPAVIGEAPREGVA
jgi:hypothetical protein